MKKTMYMMRHGQTLFNQRRRIQGACDSPLTPLGIAQAEAAREYLKDVCFDHAYCSTSERCSDTLEIVTKNKLPYQRLKGLKEMNFGMFEGESEDLNPDHEAFETFFVQYGGESSTMVRERLVSTCTEIMEKEDHHCVLVVSHAGACMNFLSEWENAVRIMKDGFGNCSILKYEYENGCFTFIEIVHPQVQEN